MAFSLSEIIAIANAIAMSVTLVFRLFLATPQNQFSKSCIRQWKCEVLKSCELRIICSERVCGFADL